MLKESGDRRAKRSRRLLKQGLTELLREKKFSEISVRDITDRMDLNRGTFYLHYTDTYELLQSVEEDVLQNVQELIDEHWNELNIGDTFRPFFEPILDYVVEHREECASLFVNNASSDFTGRVHKLLFENGSGLIRSRYPDAPEEQMGCLLDYAAFGLIGLLKHWFDTNMTMPKEQLLDAADKLVNGAAQALLQKE
ncbi:MAG: TetR/AcrR family transcriptional regulator [Oscillibacter sp.]|nr:TetR/AcrR family transcriptional regulator [Oscillibacter sp.]